MNARIMEDAEFVEVRQRADASGKTYEWRTEDLAGGRVLEKFDDVREALRRARDGQVVHYREPSGNWTWTVVDEAKDRRLAEAGLSDAMHLLDRAAVLEYPSAEATIEAAHRLLEEMRADPRFEEVERRLQGQI
jgi:hypothetical protein